jgi:DNA-binding NarL/FixJ family response regulator
VFFIPVIMLTLSDRSHVRVGMTAGADDYLFNQYAVELRQAATRLLARGKPQTPPCLKRPLKQNQSGRWRQ